MDGVLLLHGAELVHLEDPAVLCQPLLLIEHLAAVVQLYCNGAAQHNGACDDKAHDGHRKVRQPLYYPLLHCQILGRVHHHGLVVQGHVLGSLAHHVDGLEVIVYVFLCLIAEGDKVVALLYGHVIQEHGVAPEYHVQDIRVVIADYLVYLVLLFKALHFRYDVPEALP